MAELGLPFVFTDSHAYYQWANFYVDLGDLGRIDWPLLQRRDFKRDALVTHDVIISQVQNLFNRLWELRAATWADHDRRMHKFAAFVTCFYRSFASSITDALGRFDCCDGAVCLYDSCKV